MRSSEGVLVIGITGNMGAGKSVVRRMLERLGALGIDADALIHRALLKNSPVYTQVVKKFGEVILRKDGEIDRQKLAKKAFLNKKSLQTLESITHPAIDFAVRHIIQDYSPSVVAIEAIKLLESDLVALCDAIWLVDAPYQKQMERILASRALTVKQVQDRLDYQSRVEKKQQSAQVVINNGLGLDNTWNQVTQEMDKNRKFFKKFQQKQKTTLHQPISLKFQSLLPPQTKFLDKFFTSLIPPDKYTSAWPIKCSPQPITEITFEKLLSADRFELLTNYAGILHSGSSLGLINFENFLLEPILFHQPELQSMPDLIEWLVEMESIATQQLSEAIIFPLRKIRRYEEKILKNNGYSIIDKNSLLWRIWEDQAHKNHLAGYNVFYKSLRKTVVFD